MLVKFSPPNSEVLVRVFAEPHEVLIAITDEGVGLEEDELPGLFQPFGRVGVSEETEGSALGLYIAREIVGVLVDVTGAYAVGSWVAAVIAALGVPAILISKPPTALIEECRAVARNG